MGVENLIYLFEEQVNKSPDSIAVIDGNRKSTFLELDILSSQLAHELRSKGVQQEEIIAIFLPRSTQFIIAVLAILKAGATYLPLYLREPESRLRHMVTESQCNLIVSNGNYFNWTDEIEIIDIGKLINKKLPIDKPHVALKQMHSSQLAYVMYTSGSTGTPKGVCITHGAINNLALDTSWNLENQVRVLFHSQVAFDASTFEIWIPLLKGGSIVVAKEDGFTTDYLVKLIAHRKVTSVFFTTALFNLLAQEEAIHLLDLKQILFGGEQCLLDFVCKMRQKLPETDIFHVYGPTETTTFFSIYSIPAYKISNVIPIGKPMHEMSAYVLDDNFEPVRGQEIGELYISSVGMARGYLNKPGLTAEKFLPDPFGMVGSRMYQTGDLVRWNENEELVYIGRKDQQVKVRGYRVELGEVEEALRSHPKVSQASVVAQKKETGNQLLAYIVLNYGIRSSNDRLKESQVKEWKKIYEEIYKEPNLVDEAYEFVGWNSSFDGKPIALSHMHEWLGMTLERIRGLKPQKVLEIGVGTGLLLKNIYEQTELYWGTDLSEKAIIKLNAALEDHPLSSSRIKLFHQAADSINKLPKQTFDTIIINSVCQYFPDANYFVDVLNKAMNLLSPSGRIFIGDVRDFKLQRHFYTEVHLYNKKTNTVEQLTMSVERDMMMESELLISSDFFTVWSKTRSDVDCLETRLKGGDLINEMSQYRYDTVIFKKSLKEEKRCEVKDILDWDDYDFQSLKSILEGNKKQSLCLRGVPNARIAPILEACEKISNNEALEAVKETYFQSYAIKPKLEDFKALAKQNNYEISVIHSQFGNHGLVDLVFIHKSFKNCSYSNLYQRKISSYDLEAHTNYPAISREINMLLIQIKAHLQKRLPEYMWPDTIVPISKMPLTSRKKINKESLLALSSYESLGGRKAETHMEVIVCHLFGETLGLSKVLLDDNFFELGGNSLSVIILTNRFRDVLNVDVPIEVFFENPTVATLIKKMDFDSKINFLLYKQPRPNDIPLSFSQQRLWFLFNLEGPNETYNVPFTVEFSGELNIEALSDTLNDVLERHECLRTIFYEKEGRSYQRILNRAKVELEVLNVSASMDLQNTLKESSRHAFDLTKEIPIKAKLLRIDDRAYVLLIIVHHIAFDGWSFAPLWRDLSIVYSARLNNEVSNWKPLPVQYADYAIWQRNIFQKENTHNSIISRQLNYWVKNLAALPALVSLPTDYFRPKKPTYRGNRKSFVISSKLHADLVLLSEDQNATLFMVLHASLCCLLTHFGAGTDIVIGTPIAGRKDSKVRDLIGFFVNNLVLRVDTSGNPTFQKLLERVKEQDLSAYAHQDLPFDLLVQELNRSGSTGWHPLFQIMLAFQNQPQAQIDFLGLDSKFELMENESCRFDMVVNVFAENIENKNGIEGFVEYDTNLFKAATIDDFIESYIQFLKDVVEKPEMQINKTIIADYGMVLGTRAPKIVKCQEEHFAFLFQTQVDLTPDSVALSYKETTLTYGELKLAVNKLTRLLISKGMGPEKIVALAIPRSVDWIVACLAVLESGAAFMPLDHTFPKERINHMLQKSRASLVLTSLEIVSELFFVEQEMVVVDSLKVRNMLNGLSSSRIEPFELLNPLLVASPAYVIYTSGSSGTPKPVIVTHMGITQIVDAQKKRFKLGESSRVLLFASQSFDGFFWELCSLLTGASLVVVEKEGLMAGKTLVNTISNQGITHVTLPPAVLGLMENEKMEDLEMMIVSGESPKANLLSKWTYNRRIINGYGPTESTVCTTLSQPMSDNEIPNLGQAISNTTVYLLDEFLDPVPVGACGELYISGSGLARGYFNEPAMTAERFLPCPFGGVGSRMYRTGDLARWTIDGNLAFMGRMDSQIKIRGFRVEPDEIQVVLEKHPLVDQVVVKIGEDNLKNNQLDVYVTIFKEKKESEHVSSLKLRDYLKKRLPTYMMPASISIIESIPLTKNGKVNYDALMDIPRKQLKNDEISLTSTERKLYKLFCELLEIDEVGVNESFFELGGHSLLGVEFMSKLYQRWNVELPVETLFQFPSIGELGREIDELAVEDEKTPEFCFMLNSDAQMVNRIVWDVDVLKDKRDSNTPKFVLLTGATGFLGAFLIDALLKKYEQVIIYCLVRALSKEEANQRIIKNLSNYTLEQAMESNRIRALCGDLSLDDLGLASDEFDELASKLDCIYHNGAKVNGLGAYDELKKTNIKGTYEIIRLATHLKVKPIHYVSTLAVAFNNDKPEESISEEKRLKANEVLSNGYVQNKWVEEEMLWSAHKKGLPISIYRPGRIGGFSKNGIGNENDAFWQLVFAMLTIQAMPYFKAEDNLFFDLVPVDYVADAIVQISKNDDSFNGKTFNLFHKVEFARIVEILKNMGYKLEGMDYKDWKDKLKRAVYENENHKQLHKAFLLCDSLEGMFRFSSMEYCTDNIEAKAAENIIKPPMIENMILIKYIRHFIETGFFPKIDVEVSG